MDDIKISIQHFAKSIFPEIQKIRRHIHANPELSFKEYQTSEYIQNILKEHGIPFKSGVAGTGIVALINGSNPHGKTILLRADMDALPILEKNDVSYKSKNEGVMHACGHDVHTSVVLGATIIINNFREKLNVNVKIIFQPGEEVLPGGASLMIKEGVLKNPEVSEALALHVFPSMDAGKVGFRKGMYMASTDELYLTVNGKGGHAAMPAEYVNPLIIASEILLEIDHQFMKPGALKGTPGNNIPTVVAFGQIEGKGATNVIPEKVELAGTFRTMNEEWRKSVHEKLHQIVEQVSAKYKIPSQLRIEHGYPFLVNENNLTDRCIDAANHYLGKELVEELPLRMTAEDFAFISQEVPSCFFRLGTGNKTRGIVSGVHTSTFDIDEHALEIGAGLLAYLIINGLEQNN